MKELKRISIVGSPGSGKSFLARKLSKRHDVKHHDLDKVVWVHEDSQREKALRDPDDLEDKKRDSFAQLTTVFSF